MPVSPILRTRRSAGLAVALFAALLAAMPAASQESPFQSSVEVYLMGASMSGSLGMGPLESEIDVPASTIFENLDFAVLGDYRGAGRTWGVQADVVYMALGQDGTGSRGAASAHVGAKELLVEAVAVYRLSERFELLAGARYAGLKTDVRWYGPQATRTETVKEEWLDPVVGAQAFLPLSKTLELQLRGDVGGFGVGCDFTWQALARLNWQASRDVRIGVGYRALDQDYESGSGGDAFRWDVLQQGPIVAAGLRF